MERTISGMVGKGSVNHNTRAFTAKNVDSDRSGANIHFCNEDIKQVYHKLFDEALERYNEKQVRAVKSAQLISPGERRKLCKPW